MNEELIIQANGISNALNQLLMEANAKIANLSGEIELLKHKLAKEKKEADVV